MAYQYVAFRMCSLYWTVLEDKGHLPAKCHCNAFTAYACIPLRLPQARLTTHVLLPDAFLPATQQGCNLPMGPLLLPARLYDPDLPTLILWSILTGDHKDPQYTYEQVLHVGVVIHDDCCLSYEREVPASSTHRLSCFCRALSALSNIPNLCSPFFGRAAMGL